MTAVKKGPPRDQPQVSSPRQTLADKERQFLRPRTSVAFKGGHGPAPTFLDFCLFRAAAFETTQLRSCFCENDHCLPFR
jgi:hypothetical protein